MIVKGATLKGAKLGRWDFVLPCSAGRFNFSWDNPNGRLWTFPEGTVLHSDGVTPISTSTDEQPDVDIPAGGGTVILRSANWDGNYSLNDNNTDTGYLGDLSDLPNLSYYLNLRNCSNVTGDLSDLPSLSYLLSLEYCSNITGDLSDLPNLSYYLNLYNCTNVTGDLSDLPNLSYYLNLYNCSNITGDLSDLPNLSYYLVLRNCSNVTGDLSDLPSLSYLLDLGNCSNVTGDLSDLPSLSYLLVLTNCTNVTGAYTNVSGNNVPTTTNLSNTGMSSEDMDNTLIAYAACTKSNGTFTATGMTRTAASDDAVSTLTGRGWSITGITKI